LTKELYPHSEFDPELDVLRSANNTPPIPMGILPPPIDVSNCPKFTGGLAPMQTGFPPRLWSGAARRTRMRLV